VPKADISAFYRPRFLTTWTGVTSIDWGLDELDPHAAFAAPNSLACSRNALAFQRKIEQSAGQTNGAINAQACAGFRQIVNYTFDNRRSCATHNLGTLVAPSSLGFTALNHTESMSK
jgi:hypothetical protein